MPAVCPAPAFVFALHLRRFSSDVHLLARVARVCLAFAEVTRWRRAGSMTWPNLVRTRRGHPIRAAFSGNIESSTPRSQRSLAGLRQFHHQVGVCSAQAAATRRDLTGSGS